MEEPRTWIVCRHVVDGLAEKAILNKDLTTCLNGVDELSPKLSIIYQKNKERITTKRR